MRTGRLDTPADLLALGSNLQPELLDMLWVGIRAKESADPPAAVGLRSPAKVEVQSWWDARLIQGRYLRAEDRLLYITSARDFRGDRFELAITCEELVGEVAHYTPPSGGAVMPCRVFLTHGVARPGEFAGKSEYTTQLEAALIEVGRPQPGGVFQVGAQAWRVSALVDDDDDRIVRRMWVKRS